MKNAVKDITLYHLTLWADTETMARNYIRAVSVFGTAAVAVGDGGLNAADVYTIRIPEERGTYAIAEGDLVVFGEATEEGVTRAKLQSKYKTATVVSCTDNTGKRGGHYKVVCK